MKYQTYFRMTLLLPFVIPLITIVSYFSIGEDALSNLIPQPLYSTMLLATVGLMYVGIPYIIFMIIVFIKLNSWTYLEAIKCLKLSPIYLSVIYSVLITIFLVFFSQVYLFEFKEAVFLILYVTAAGAVFTIIFGYFYVLLILGGINLGQKYGFINK